MRQIAASLAASIAMVMAAAAQDNYEQRVLLGLTVSTNTAEKTSTTSVNGVTTYTESGTVITRRYGNAELLRDLVSEGVISSVDGWSLVFRNTRAGDKLGFFLVKPGFSPINLKNYIKIDRVTESLSTYAYKEVESATATTETEATPLRMRMVEIDLDVADMDTDIHGIMVETGASWNATDANPVGERVPGTISLQNFVGAFGDYDEDCDIDDTYGSQSNSSGGSDDSDRDDNSKSHHGLRNEDWGLIQGVTKLMRGRLVLVP